VSWLILCSLTGLLVGAAVAWFAAAGRRKDSGLELLQQQLTGLNQHMAKVMADVTSITSSEIGRLNQRLDERLKETSHLVQTTHQSVGERLDRNTEVFGRVQQSLTRLEETNRQIQNVGQEIARLQEVLRAPKLRGNLGELFLEELLSQILPRTYYEMQYSFRSGLKVDAVIRLPKNHLVPIDAKFPLENFQRMIAANVPEPEREAYRKQFAVDFRKHVDSIASKYIVPDEGTLDFALMYIPAENIYYEAILRDEKFGEGGSINAYALKRRVIPVSPNSLYAYLQAIVLGLRGLHIEARAEEIFKFLEQLRNELQRLSEDFDLVGKHLTNASSAFEKGNRRLDKVRTRVDELESTRTDESEPLLEEPEKVSKITAASS